MSSVDSSAAAPPIAFDAKSVSVYVALQLVLAQASKNQQAQVEAGVEVQQKANQRISDLMAINVILNAAIGGQTDATKTASPALTAAQQTELARLCQAARIELPTATSPTLVAFVPAGTASLTGSGSTTLRYTTSTADAYVYKGPTDGKVKVGDLQTAVSTVDAAIKSAQSTQQIDLITLQDLINKLQETFTQLTNVVKGEHDSNAEIARNIG